MTFQQSLTVDMSEYMYEYYRYDYERLDDGFTVVSLVDISSYDPVLFLYYGEKGYCVVDTNDNILFESRSYRKLVEYLNRLDWEE